MKHANSVRAAAAAFFFTLSMAAHAQESRPQGEPREGGPPDGMPFGPPRGMVREDIRLVEKFDADKNGWLDAKERVPAREEMKRLEAERPRFGPGGGGPPGFGRNRGNEAPPQPGPKLSPKDVKNINDNDLYTSKVLRTIFLQFENANWEEEMAAFHGSDVDLPATMTVDGKEYKNVGVRFRGNSSYMMVRSGYKRSLNVSVDMADSKARLLGYKTLNLLNANGDPTMMRAALYSAVARTIMPAPKANLVRVVIQGENWGIYENLEQFNKDFLSEYFKNTKGTRWKVPGAPWGGGALAWKGEDLENYKSLYEIKSDKADEAAKAWEQLVNLCKVLEFTPADALESALTPILDVDGVLRFLAVDNVLINEDGYWTRGSDFSIFLDHEGKFHIFPYDMNEGLKAAGGGPGFPGGPGFGGGRGRGGRRGGNPGGPGGGPESRPQGGGASLGMKLDPLYSIKDSGKPLISKLLAVPALKQRYLQYVKLLAENSLDWKKLGPMVENYTKMIDADVAADTHKLDTYDAFREGVGAAAAPKSEAPGGEGAAGMEGPPGRRSTTSLKQFAEERRKYLLDLPILKDLPPLNSSK